jgi:hypothetical protein
MSNNADTINVGLYKSQLVGDIGTGGAYWAAIGPHVHVVCQSKQQADDVAMALNGAYLVGVMQTLKERGHL